MAERLFDDTHSMEAGATRLLHGFIIRSAFLFSADSREYLWVVQYLWVVPINRTVTLLTPRDPFGSLMACSYWGTPSSSSRLLNFNVPELVRPITIG